MNLAVKPVSANSGKSKTLSALRFAPVTIVALTTAATLCVVGNKALQYLKMRREMNNPELIISTEKHQWYQATFDYRSNIINGKSVMITVDICGVKQLFLMDEPRDGENPWAGLQEGDRMLVNIIRLKDGGIRVKDIRIQPRTTPTEPEKKPPLQPTKEPPRGKGGGGWSPTEVA